MVKKSINYPGSARVGWLGCGLSCPSEAEAVRWMNNVSDRWTANVLAGNQRRHARNGRSLVQLIADRLHLADGWYWWGPNSRSSSARRCDLRFD